MAHIIEVERHSKAEACSFLDALFYSDSVSAIGHRLNGEKTKVIAINWDADEESELDEKMRADDYCFAGNGQRTGCALRLDFRIYPETVLYQPEITNIE